MENKRKFDTLTKNAVIDDILAQVRERKAEKERAAASSQKSGDKYFDKVYTAKLDIMEEDGKFSSQKVLDKEEKQPEKEEKTAVQPPVVQKKEEKPVKAEDKPAQNTQSTKVVSQPTLHTSVGDIAAFFGSEETPDHFLTEEDLLEEKQRKNKKLFSFKKIKVDPVDTSVLPKVTEEKKEQSPKQEMNVDLNLTDEVVLEIDDKKAEDLKEYVQQEVESGTQQLDKLQQQAKELEVREKLRKNRQEAVKNFKVQLPTDQAQEEEEKQNPPEEKASTPEDEIESLLSLRSKLRLRMGLTFALGAVLLYHNLALPLYKLPMPGFLSPAFNPFGYLVANLLLLLPGLLICTSTIINGLGYGVTLRGDNDSPVAFAYAASLIQAVVLLFVPNSINSIHMGLFGGLSMLSLWFNCIGKLNIVQRTLRNWRFLTAGTKKNACRCVEDESLISAVGAELNFDNPVVAYRGQAPDEVVFFEDSFEDDISDTFSKYMAPVVLLFAVGMGIWCGLQKGGIVTFVYVLSMLTAVAAPFTLMLVYNLPFSRACRKINRFAGIIGSYRALKNVNKITTLAVSDSDLFAAGNVHMHGIKTFGGERIDDALLKVTSVLNTQKSAIGSVFLNIIQNNTGLLELPENCMFENGLGYAGWLDNKRILVGNRRMMEAHSITLPSHDFEDKYRKEGDRELLYLAQSGELLAMFVISYTPNAKVSALIERMRKADLSLAVCTKDPCVSMDVLKRVYDLDEQCCVLLGNHITEALGELSAKECSDTADLLCMDNMISCANSVLLCMSVKNKILVSILAQTTGILMGLALCTYFLLWSAGGLSAGLVVMYQLIWCLILLGIHIVKK